MWKKLIAIVLVFGLVSVFAVTYAEAGSRQHDMWGGAGIVLGAAALGAMAYQLFTHPSQPPQVVYYPPPPPPEYVSGHWESTREWLPGTWERVWVPGYYDHWGKWVRGHYEGRQTPGHYVERRIWVEGYYRHN